MANNIFSKSQIEKADEILHSPHSKLSGLLSHEIKELAVVWCYYSGKIEGNTYTLVETEALLKDGITSEHAYRDAKELKNLYNTFIRLLEATLKEKNSFPCDKRTVFTIHSMLTEELLPNDNRGTFRLTPVKVSGTAYVPPTDEIENLFEKILKNQDTFNHILEKAVYLHCNIARLQPFLDGNKRTSRMVESLVLMNNDLIPVYSGQDKDILAYRKALINFYEYEDYGLYADYFLDRQLERIQQASKPTVAQKNEPSKNRHGNMHISERETG
jgi:Fic family protein